MTFKTTVLCVSIILFFITVEHLRYLPKNVIKKHFRSEFRGREHANRKLFSDYLRRFNKSYEPEEFHKRFRHFKKNLKEIERLNDGLNHATFGVTKFSDWSQKERFRMLAPQLAETCKGGERANNCTKTRLDRAGGRIDGLKDGKTPLRWNWTEHGAVGPIFDQKICQICWAASIAGVMESMAAINGLGLTSLSKQQLIDCTFDEGTDKTGCHHGRPLTDVFENMCNEHIKLTTEARYPLTFADEDCKRVQGQRGLARYEINCTMHKDEKNLVEAIARGPVTALVDARLLFNYLSGIVTHHCTVLESDLNHAVQIVGYDTTAQPPYYIVKNSWGEDWGEKGYARFAIGGNQCGIAYSIGILDVY